ncbi:MAG: hypothetical protein DVB23_003278 [Verrucomicrobia bacterium]|jgi:hypothetical protein|nr:MAG: hypothetical protein DVB23_003278 [Verrucomicrobiota bacterium]
MIADKSAKLFFGWMCSAAPVLDVGEGIDVGEGEPL